VEDFLLFLKRTEKRMMGLNNPLGYHGRLVLVNSILSTLSTFYMCILKIPINILGQVDKYRKHYIWNKRDINRRGGCLVAWNKATKSRSQGGLGIIDLRAHNTVMLFKFLHKFYN
jgi:hypothetical protein